MIDRGGSGLQVVDIPVALVRPEDIGIGTAGRNPEVDEGLAGDRNAIYCHRVAVWVERRRGWIGGNEFARSIGILRKRHRWQLIEIGLAVQLCTFAAHIRNGGHSISQYLMLQIEVPLLNIRPARLRRNCVHTQREYSGCASTSCISDNIVYLDSIGQWRRVF